MTATAGPDNQLITVNGAAQTYDLRGNLRKGVLPSGTMGSLAETYTFDARNRLTAMEGGHRFAYDVANNRVGITSGTSTTDFYLTPLGGLSQVVSEKTTTVGSDAASDERFYIYTPQGQLLYHLDPDIAGDISSSTRFKASHYHYDLTGSTVALSGDDGRGKGRVFYTPYGEITHRDAAVNTRFLFCGAYGVQTDASGLVYMRARYYHPYLARFLNEDPIEFEGGMNWYAYVNGNPLNLVDPTGLEATDGPWGGFWGDALLNSGLLEDAAYGWSQSDWTSAMGITGKAANGVGMVAGAADAAGNLATLGVKAMLIGIVEKFGREGLEAALKTMAKEAAGNTTSTIKNLTEQAADLVPLNNGRNRVTLRSPSQQMEIDLAGKSHAGVPTPHTKVSPLNPRAPNQPAYNTKNSLVVPATQQEIRTVRRYLERQN
jgi:RHS repeat-associated protein